AARPGRALRRLLSRAPDLPGSRAPRAFRVSVRRVRAAHPGWARARSGRREPSARRVAPWLPERERGACPDPARALSALDPRGAAPRAARVRRSRAQRDLPRAPQARAAGRVVLEYGPEARAPGRGSGGSRGGRGALGGALAKRRAARALSGRRAG